MSMPIIQEKQLSMLFLRLSQVEEPHQDCWQHMRFPSRSSILEAPLVEYLVCRGHFMHFYVIL